MARLRSFGPAGGEVLGITTTPFWVGNEVGCAVRLLRPDVIGRHAVILEREDGFWLSPGRGLAQPVRVNGTAVSGDIRLRHGDQLQIVPGAEYVFETHASSPRIEPELEQELPSPQQAWIDAPDATTRNRTRKRSRAKRRPRKRAASSSHRPTGLKLAIAGIIVLVLAGLTLMILVLQRPPSVAPISDADVEYFDELMIVASDRVERATALLEIGLNDLALQEFAQALNSLETSELGENPWVQPRIVALEAAIADIFRSRRLPVPGRYSGSAAGAGGFGSLLRPNLTVPEFTRLAGVLEERFRLQFGRQLVITGRDHQEHLALYGRGGALDLRTRDLTAPQLAYLVGTARALGLRVKDFSSDSVLQDQIRRAVQAGLADRAGTGLHLHVDRFTARRDRYTTY